jgi:hypothetical protein
MSAYLMVTELNDAVMASSGIEDAPVVVNDVCFPFFINRAEYLFGRYSIPSLVRILYRHASISSG